MRDFYKNLILLIASSIAAVAVFYTFAELILSKNYYDWKSQGQKKAVFMGKLTVESLNTRLIWEYRPNAEASYRGSPRIQTNRFGFRERTL